MSLAIKSALAALAISAALSPAALAQNSTASGSVRVAYSDLAMSTPADGEILLKRIRVAARKACRDVVPNSPVSPRALIVCRQDAVEQAVHGLRLPALTAAWSGNQSTALASR